VVPRRPLPPQASPVLRARTSGPRTTSSSRRRLYPKGAEGVATMAGAAAVTSWAALCAAQRAGVGTTPGRERPPCGAGALAPALSRGSLTPLLQLSECARQLVHVVPRISGPFSSLDACETTHASIAHFRMKRCSAPSTLCASFSVASPARSARPSGVDRASAPFVICSCAMAWSMTTLTAIGTRRLLRTTRSCRAAPLHVARRGAQRLEAPRARAACNPENHNVRRREIDFCRSRSSATAPPDATFRGRCRHCQHHAHFVQARPGPQGRRAHARNPKRSRSAEPTAIRSEDV